MNFDEQRIAAELAAQVFLPTRQENAMNSEVITNQISEALELIAVAREDINSGLFAEAMDALTLADRACHVAFAARMDERRAMERTPEPVIPLPPFNNELDDSHVFIGYI